MQEISDHIKLLHAEVANLLQKKKNEEDILEHITSKGYERYYAEMILDNVKEEAADKKSFKKTFFYGLGFLVTGILVSLASRYFALSIGAAFYIFYWGLIVAGISIIARAFIIFKR